ncbi:hypothetical protein H4W33_006434 [Kibdelosporangium phytohabitans]|nr:hypothetical protein [Kibdelosporangium phytohabitans]
MRGAISPRTSCGIALRAGRRISAAACSSVAFSSSQDSGRNNRQSSAAEAQSVTACTITPI